MNQVFSRVLRVDCRVRRSSGLSGFISLDHQLVAYLGSAPEDGVRGQFKHTFSPKDRPGHPEWADQFPHGDHGPKLGGPREDLWSIAQETFGDRVQQMQAYFTTLRLPGEPGTEFASILPFTPSSTRSAAG